MGEGVWWTCSSRGKGVTGRRRFAKNGTCYLCVHPISKTYNPFTLCNYNNNMCTAQFLVSDRVPVNGHVSFSFVRLLTARRRWIPGNQYPITVYAYTRYVLNDRLVAAVEVKRDRTSERDRTAADIEQRYCGT